jgi:capsular polysaccharide export protein
MIPRSLDHLLARRRTLLLQGPMGAFFARLAEVLRANGQQVWKVNFNGGDEHYYPADGEAVLAYRAPLAAFRAWLDEQISRLEVDTLVLFGQSRPLHAEAMALARARGVAVFVFEEGYFRPDYVTLEQDGVNADSSIPSDPVFYRDLNIETQPTPQPTHQQFGEVANIAMTYALALWAGSWRYRHYVHHRCLHPVREGLRWVRGGARKWGSRWAERGLQAFLAAPAMHKRYFLVPLQVHNDAQILCHSPYGEVTDFIQEVITSFAEHAPADQWLVLKHHPLDKPYKDYRHLIASRARALGVADRVLYLHDQHLPTLLQHARGVVTVNSTTGLQAMFHGTPVITLGDCLYAVKGLVHPGPLATFWTAPGEVDRDLFNKFRAYVIRETQLNASFYADAPGLPASTGPRRRLASSADTPTAAAQAADWSSPTAPTLK